MLELVADSITHHYGGKQTLNGVSFSLSKGDIGCLIGPSGSGKTTVLLCIAGLERLSAGRVSLGGRQLSGDNLHLSPEKRRIGMVFQDFALFPHLSARDNIGFGLRLLSPAAKRARIEETAELCDVRALADAYPHELSGGEQQRVALARALAMDPDLLLLDEPFSRLDAALHEKLCRQVHDILKSRRQTTLFVTHNQNEAFYLADIGGVINEGAICQWGGMDDLYHRPRCTFVAGFVGDGALLRGIFRADGAVDGALGRLAGDALDGNPLLRPGEAVKVLLRPDDVIVGNGAVDGSESGGGARAVVSRRVFRGATTLYSLRLDNGEEVLSIAPSRDLLSPGDNVSVRARVRNLVLFPALSE